jgi:hypothetical protein
VKHLLRNIVLSLQLQLGFAIGPFGQNMAGKWDLEKKWTGLMGVKLQ